jgi:hypothetical protein
MITQKASNMQTMKLFVIAKAIGQLSLRHTQMVGVSLILPCG